MTPFISSYSLQAFPTEKVLREFKAVRGLVAMGKIELPPDTAELLPLSQKNHQYDPLAWKKPQINPDLSPLIRAIAERLGYDPALLAEGKGETGKPNHDWIAYSHQGTCPLLVRWRAGQGSLLLSASIFSNDLTLTLLTDEAGLETYLQVADILLSIETPPEWSQTLEIPTGNTIQKVTVSSQKNNPFYIAGSIKVCLPADRQFNAVRQQDLKQLGFGIRLTIGTEEEINAGGFEKERKPLKPNCLRIQDVLVQGEDLDFGPDEPLSLSIIKKINGASVKMACTFMTMALAEAFNGEVAMPNLYNFDGKESLDVEVEERKMQLQQLTNRKFFYSRPKGRLTFGPGVYETPPEILRHTRPVAKMSGGDVGVSCDLLKLLFEYIYGLVNEAEKSAESATKPKLIIKGEAQLPSLAAQYEDTAKFYCRTEELKSPYYSAHLGLPVRVDKRLIVWRKGDTEALAADFFHLPTNQDTHIAHLRRVKIPQD